MGRDLDMDMLPIKMRVSKQFKREVYKYLKKFDLTLEQLVGLFAKAMEMYLEKDIFQERLENFYVRDVDKDLIEKSKSDIVELEYYIFKSKSEIDKLRKDHKAKERIKVFIVMFLLTFIKNCRPYMETRKPALEHRNLSKKEQIGVILEMIGDNASKQGRRVVEWLEKEIEKQKLIRIHKFQNETNKLVNNLK
jgi:hypothetical protein